MNSIEVQIKENLEPGISLANVIGEQNSNETIQPISSIISHTDSERQSLNDLDNLKYKTELCRNFTAYGCCSYSSRCQFAHGFEELRCRTRHPKYKTELCRNFLSGFCKYGSRCQFLHNSNESSPTVVTALETYLLTNMLVQSAALGLEESLNHQLTLAQLANYNNIYPKTNLIDSCLKRSCGIEMQRIHLSSPNIYHGLSLVQNQNNNDTQIDNKNRIIL